jgi:hypothetical protein
MPPAETPPTQRTRAPRTLSQTRGLGTTGLNVTEAEEAAAEAITQAQVAADVAAEAAAEAEAAAAAAAIAEAAAAEAAEAAEVVVAAAADEEEDEGETALRPATSLLHLRIQAIADNIANLAPGRAEPGAEEEAEAREGGISFKALALVVFVALSRGEFGTQNVLSKWFAQAGYEELTDILPEGEEDPELALQDFLEKMEDARDPAKYGATAPEKAAIDAIEEEHLEQFFEITSELQLLLNVLPPPAD